MSREGPSPLSLYGAVLLAAAGLLCTLKAAPDSMLSISRLDGPGGHLDRLLEGLPVIGAASVAVLPGVGTFFATVVGLAPIWVNHHAKPARSRQLTEWIFWDETVAERPIHCFAPGA
jgi:hypothetical protein